MSFYFERIKFVSNQTVDYLIIPYIILPDCIISNIQLKSMRKWKLLCRFMMNVSIVLHSLGWDQCGMVSMSSKTDISDCSRCGKVVLWYNISIALS